ncbi:unnamed protein product [Paramecium sonneborni]|uniref:Uncharacterized protein n=1 Tax=Paramecium sonneborni TaxID=65129 RepID=A0A8S1R7E1_9CILI|nr:unnamed protein product [Paramecium sonneborni]
MNQRKFRAKIFNKFLSKFCSCTGQLIFDRPDQESPGNSCWAIQTNN